MLTSVTRFVTRRMGLYETVAYEAVADTRLKLDPPVLATHFDDPSISIFDGKCEMVWHQTYPLLGEVGFRPVTLPGHITMLQVAAVSGFEPVDQVIWDEELLSFDGLSVQAAATFGVDRFSTSYFGPIGRRGTLGLLKEHWDYLPWVPWAVTPPVFKATIAWWEAVPNALQPERPPTYKFGTPKSLTQKEVDELKLPPTASHPPFPLYKFVFDINDPG